MSATSSSQSVSPVVMSTRKSTRSASSVAMTTCLRISSSKISSDLTTHPPVSTTENSLPFHSHLPYWRSRVVPASSLTIALLDLVRRLKSVDLPTLGRPTMATNDICLTIYYSSTYKTYSSDYSGLYPKLSSSFFDERQSLSTLTNVSRKMLFPKNFSRALRDSVLTFFSATP